ncbi:MAG: hypothetical protein QNJ12_14690 [Ilumatobacter sp.]|uniref:hypothetical protein n=1 Tax=Ilumatobacter sp. TaxID=1967498 RepID=UPI00261A2B38|nr:hypothetical protein [Ilumatobacter sp.]MDJ0770046.1 hypothetical protein [Ilumatobacter sp.]
MTTGDGVRHWIIDGNNVYGSRPDGWWNDRSAAATRFTQRVAVWCRAHADEVTIVFDAPVDDTTLELGGGNLAVVEAPRRGRDAADDHIVELAAARLGTDESLTVVTSDRGLRARLPESIHVVGAGRFRSMIGY